MAWVYIGVSLGLLGFLLEMVLVYRKAADRLRVEQEKVRHSTRLHVQATVELQQTIEATKTGIEHLNQEKAKLVHEVNWNKATLAELEEKEKRRSLTRHKLEDENAG